jgi:hypothetical protein
MACIFQPKKPRMPEDTPSGIQTFHHAMAATLPPQIGPAIFCIERRHE